MSDLIRRSALIEEFRKCHISFNGTPMEESDMMISYRSIVRVINRQPPVEARPVVHCRDCCFLEVCKTSQWLGLDGYCSRGEKLD